MGMVTLLLLGSVIAGGIYAEGNLGILSDSLSVFLYLWVQFV